MERAIPPLMELRPDLAELIECELAPIPQWFREYATCWDLVGWTCVAQPGNPFRYQRACEPRNSRLMVIVSGNIESDGHQWVHVSFSRPSRSPSYEDLCLVKERFIGPDRKAITVHPPRSEHVNIHKYCLHLWCCLDADVLPDFRKAGGRVI